MGELPGGPFLRGLQWYLAAVGAGSIGFYGFFGPVLLATRWLQDSLFKHDWLRWASAPLPFLWLLFWLGVEFYCAYKGTQDLSGPNGGHRARKPQQASPPRGPATAGFAPRMSYRPDSFRARALPAPPTNTPTIIRITPATGSPRTNDASPDNTSNPDNAQTNSDTTAPKPLPKMLPMSPSPLLRSGVNTRNPNRAGGRHPIAMYPHSSRRFCAMAKLDRTKYPLGAEVKVTSGTLRGLKGKVIKRTATTIRVQFKGGAHSFDPSALRLTAKKVFKTRRKRTTIGRASRGRLG